MSSESDESSKPSDSGPESSVEDGASKRDEDGVEVDASEGEESGPAETSDGGDSSSEDGSSDEAVSTEAADESSDADSKENADGDEPSSASKDPATSKQDGRSLGRAAARGTLWVVGGFGVSQVARLGGAVLLSRLLFPEAFGIMRIVNTIMMVIGLITDAGLRGSIIYHKRGDDPDFLNTAWTLQCIRGVLVAVVLSAIAWPMADFYEMPELRWLLPVIGSSIVVLGMQSTSIFTLARRVNPKPPAMLEVGLRIGGLAVMVSLAMVWKSVWVLALGTIISNVGKGIISHFFIRGYRNRWKFDREAVRDQISFGKWVFISSALAAALNQGDSAIVGKLLSTDEFGVFAVAIMLATAGPNAMGAVGRSVLQPLYAKFNTGNKKRLRGRVFKVRGALMAVALPALWFVGIFGSELVDLLFDDRYLAAGWMLRIMIIGSVGTVVIATAEMMFVAAGDSFSHVVHKGLGAVFFFGGLALGYAIDDFRGLLIGMSLGRVAGYLPMAYLLHKRGAWLPKLDMLALVSSAVVMGLGFLLHPLEIL